MLLSTVQEVEPNDDDGQATVFTMPNRGKVNLVGRTGGDDDDDYFRFTAGRDGRIAVNVLKRGGADELEVDRANRDDDDLLELDLDDEERTGSFRVRQGVTYLIELDADDDNDRGRYKVLLRFASGPQNKPNRPNKPKPQNNGLVRERENNDSKSRATKFNMPANGGVTLAGTFSDDDDDDYFSFVAPRDGRINVKIALRGRIEELEISRAGGDDDVLELDDDDNNGSFFARQGTRYFIELDPDDDDGPLGPYRVRVNYA